MNVFLPKKLLLGLLALLAFPALTLAQTVNLETYRGAPVEYYFSSTPSNPSLVAAPAHGTVAITNLGQNNYVLTYTPNSAFVGNDEFRIAVWMGITWEIRKVVISVKPSKVIARDDIIYTYLNEPVDIDVLVNDYASAGDLEVKSVTLVNNGAAEIVDGKRVLFFLPNEEYRGVAQLTYVACDIYGACDQATVSVVVLGAPEDGPDTLRIFTKKNQSQVVLTPPHFKLILPPAHGQYNATGDLPIYQPNAGYVGKDYLELADGANLKVVEVTVLDVTDNIFAVDDEVYTTSFNSAEFNVLKNDLYGASSGCLTLNSPPQYGQVQFKSYPYGTATYIPNPGFQGVDKFTYTIQPPNCNGAPETATVYVYVSNFEPAYNKFRLVTPKRTPLIIGYSVPIRNFEFAINDEASLGKVRILPGRVDTLINNQRVQGYNLILYIPDQNVNSGLDDFEITYCVTKSGECQYRKIIKIEVDILDVGDGTQPMCITDCIWPGDTNLDGMVNVEDLLPLGLYMGRVGLPRQADDESEWFGQYGPDWGTPIVGFASGDLKHVDTNGDSLITALDTAAIAQYYGRTHSLAPSRVPNYKHFIRLRGNLTYSPGDLVELDLVLGTANSPAVNVYGFTFPFEFNPEFFVPSSASIEYATNSWLSYHSPVLSMTKNVGGGALESAFTRTNGVSATGHGKIGRVRIVVADDIAGFRPGDEDLIVPLGGGVAAVMEGSGLTFGMKVEEVDLRIRFNPVEPESPPLDPRAANELLKVFPNPTPDFINVHLNGGRDFQRLMVHDLTGRLVYDSGNQSARSKRINISQFPNGIYVLSAQTEAGILRQKFEVLH
jgi:hypothetical protein